MSVSIRVRHLTLEVPLFIQEDRSARSWLHTLAGAVVARPRREFLTILNDVSFSLVEGDRVALIGRNGAGKSTLLRVMTGAYLPTRGEALVRGSYQALLNIRLGFNPHATVMENIFLRGTAMRIPARRLRELVGPILQFSGLEEMAQQRLYTLSSGQRMRLGFAIATSIEHDIILMDEWLGAGDAEFLAKARKRMNDRVHGSRIVVLASHNDKLLRRTCNKGLYLEKGRVKFFGPVEEALAAYKDDLRLVREKTAAREALAWADVSD